MLKAYSPVRPRVKPVTCCLSGRQRFLAVHARINSASRDKSSDTWGNLTADNATMPLWCSSCTVRVVRPPSSFRYTTATQRWAGAIHCKPPPPKKLFGKEGCREATLAPVASRSIIPKPRSGRSSNPLKLLPHIYTVCALPTASDKTISYWDL